MREDAAVPGSVVVRAARPEDAEAISALITSLARYFLADPDHPEAAAEFWPTIGPAAIAAALAGERHRYHVAEVDGALAGVVGVRDGSHLYHLFVAETFHGRGIGSRLWGIARGEALARGNPGRFTVNSSRHAIGLYERLGFVATDALQAKHGLEFLPMQLVEST
jgi:ribosomal protein S18 acetylase RimI-like enzyme